MIVFTRKKWLFTSGFNCRVLTWKILEFWIGRQLWEVVRHCDLTAIFLLHAT